MVSTILGKRLIVFSLFSEVRFEPLVLIFEEQKNLLQAGNSWHTITKESKKV